MLRRTSASKEVRHAETSQLVEIALEDSSNTRNLSGNQ